MVNLKYLSKRRRKKHPKTPIGLGDFFNHRLIKETHQNSRFSRNAKGSVESVLVDRGNDSGLVVCKLGHVLRHVSIQNVQTNEY